MSDQLPPPQHIFSLGQSSYLVSQFMFMWNAELKQFEVRMRTGFGDFTSYSCSSITEAQVLISELLSRLRAASEHIQENARTDHELQQLRLEYNSKRRPAPAPSRPASALSKTDALAALRSLGMDI